MSHSLESGDLLLFDGDSFSSKLIKFFTISNWSHAAIVFKCPVSKNLFIWENGEIGKDIKGVIKRRKSPNNSAHLVPLKLRLKNYNGIVYVRKLLKNAPLDNEKLGLFIAENIGNSYSWDLVASWNERGGNSIIPLTFLEDHTEGENGWICSQLVVLTYEYLGILNLEKPSHTYFPVDLLQELPTTKNYTFLDPQLLSYNLNAEI